MAKQHGRTLRKQIRSVRSAMGQLVHALEALLPLLRAAGRVDSKPARRAPTVTSARRAALRLHGIYLGRIRSLKAREKARVKLVYQEKGVKAAISLAKRLRK